MSDQSTYQKIEAHGREIDRLKSLQGGGSSGVTSVSGTAPVVSSGGATPAISLAVTPANPGGAVAIQATTPGSVQTGNIDVSGKIIANILDAPNHSIGGVPILVTGTTFPSGGLVDGQRYRHETFNSWFFYQTATGLWRQENPGTFSGSFPTVSAGVNAVAPKIEVKRNDRNNLVYYWDGTRWLGPQTVVTIPYLPGVPGNAFTALANNVWFDVHPDNSSDVWVESISTIWRVVTTNDSSNYWSWVIRFRNSAGATAVTATVDTKLFSLATQTPITVLSNTLVTRANFYDVYFDIGKTLSPGTLSTSPVKFYYRLVG